MLDNMRFQIMLFPVVMLVACHHCDSEIRPAPLAASEELHGYDFWKDQSGKISAEGARLLSLQWNYVRDPSGKTFEQLGVEIAYDLKEQAAKFSEADVLLLFGMPNFWRGENNCLLYAYLRGDTLVLVALDPNRYLIEIGFNSASSFTQSGWHNFDSNHEATQP
jgi:hypothetical protein